MAEQFDRSIGLTGVILTKVEGDARGGAVLSIKAVTGKPISFGDRRKLDSLEPFHPESGWHPGSSALEMSSR